MMKAALLAMVLVSYTAAFMPPFACMCASGDGRATDDYLSSLSAGPPDKYRATPAFYKLPAYPGPPVRKRDRVKAFFKNNVAVRKSTSILRWRKVN